MKTMAKSEQSVVDLASTAAAASALQPKPDMIEAFAGRLWSYLRKRRERRQLSTEPWASPLAHAGLLDSLPALLTLYEEATVNAFCPTGEGGGIDPTCSPRGREGSGKVRKQAGFEIVSGVKSVKKASDFEYTNTYHVTLDNGDVHSIFFDRQSSIWMHANPKGTSVRDQYLAISRSDVLPRLVEMKDRYNTNESPIIPDSPLSPITNVLPSQASSAAALYDLSDEYTRRESREVARAVLRGYANDKSVSAISKVIQRQLGIDKAQADVLAQTELTRVAAADQLSEAGKAAEAQGKKGKVRFITGVDSCPICTALHGKVYSLDKAQEVIPVHPNCTCRWQAL